MNRLQRTTGLAAGLLSTAFAAAALSAAPANADDANTLTVVGTSDVFDSALVQNVIEPGFEQAYPGVNLNYVSKGTGAAIAYAEQGAASAMIVHAASLENQFVADGYSLEQYGRAIFWGDYVLAGPPSDPAGVLPSGAQNITAAFQKVAKAAAAGKADFVSRGGTPGTTVQEHAIWATTTGVNTCTVSDANGGGTSPSTTSGPCSTPIAFPSWYHATGLTQGPNILNASTCNYPNAINGGGNDCYVFTDRGTFNYLQSTNQAKNLKILTRATSKTPSALSNLLVNSFHAYAINPGKFSGATAAGINTVQATNFLNYITSPETQQKIGQYLAEDPPFIPSAAPRITLKSALPGSLANGKSLTIKGSLVNVTPGTPALSGETVKLYATPTGGSPALVTTATTDSKGAFTLTTKPQGSATYTIRTDQIAKVERPDLSPVFGDLLAPTSTTLGYVTVDSSVTLSTPKPNGAKTTFQLKGKISPVASGDGAYIAVFAAPAGDTLAQVSTVPLANGAATFDATYTPGSPGDYQVQVRYVNTGVVNTSVSKTYTVRSQ